MDSIVLKYLMTAVLAIVLSNMMLMDEKKNAIAGTEIDQLV